jgi:hypothetical protein
MDRPLVGLLEKKNFLQTMLYLLDPLLPDIHALIGPQHSQLGLPFFKITFPFFVFIVAINMI